MESRTLVGQLLVAQPALEDPNFDRSVILMLRHDAREGAFGLVLNRASGFPLEEELAEWGPLAAPPQEVFVGGPVEPTVIFGLGWLLPEADMPDGVEPILDRLGLVDLGRSPEDLPELFAVRLFAGYSGWGPGQLEAEIAQGAWLILKADPWDAASGDPDNLWREVFRRQEGDLRMLATYPDDPSDN